MQAERECLKKTKEWMVAWSAEEGMDPDEYKERMEKKFTNILQKKYPAHANEVLLKLFPTYWDGETMKFKSKIEFNVDRFLEGHVEQAPCWASDELVPCEGQAGQMPVGIKNEKNICYLIAAVQLFNSIPALRHAVLEVRARVSSLCAGEATTAPCRCTDFMTIMTVQSLHCLSCGVFQSCLH